MDNNKTDNKRSIINKKQILYLILIYSLSQIILCFISGQWWDDWVIWCSSAETTKDFFRSNGLPWEAYNLFSVMCIPKYGYKIVVFFEYLIGGILFYGILRTLNFFSDQDAFWITTIYMTVPVNDARITLICYGYSLSLFLFLMSFFIISRNRNKASKYYIPLRIFSVLCLLYSYTMQSLLVFTGLIWLYQLYRLFTESYCKKPINLILNCIRENADYIISPFLFFILKSIFIKPYGHFEGYNNVSLNTLCIGLVSFPKAAVQTLITITTGYCNKINIYTLSLIVICAGTYLCISKRKKSTEYPKTDLKHSLLLFVLGVAVYSAGIFAYIVVRNGGALDSTGVGGRDTMLAAFGISISVWAIVNILRLPKKLQELIFIAIIVLGIFHFNDAYLNYQEDWYHQQEFAYEISKNEELAESDKTVLCVFSDPSPVGATRFYTLNGMSYRITGKMDKFYFSSIEDLKFGVRFNEYFKHGWNADDYDYYDTSIDSVLFINNYPVDNIKIVKLRINELFNHPVFEQEIADMSDITYVKTTENTSDKIYDAFNNGTLDEISLLQIIGAGA